MNQQHQAATMQVQYRNHYPRLRCTYATHDLLLGSQLMPHTTLQHRAASLISKAPHHKHDSAPRDTHTYRDPSLNPRTQPSSSYSIRTITSTQATALNSPAAHSQTQPQLHPHRTHTHRSALLGNHLMELSPLKKFLAELRNRIYELTLFTTGGVVLKARHGKLRAPKGTMALARTCQQLRRERLRHQAALFRAHCQPKNRLTERERAPGAAA